MNKKIIILVLAVSFFTIFVFSKIVFSDTGGGMGGITCPSFTLLGSTSSLLLDASEISSDWTGTGTTPRAPPLNGLVEGSMREYNTPNGELVKLDILLFDSEDNAKNYLNASLNSFQNVTLGVICGVSDALSFERADQTSGGYTFKGYMIRQGKYTIGFYGYATWDSLKKLLIAFANKYASSTCTDSDGGINYYVYGTVQTKDSFSSGTYYDLCWNGGNELHEWYCSGTLAKESIYNCPAGCKDGACIKKTCVNHNECSQACDNLGITYHWSGSKTNSWTGSCTLGTYGCMTGDCCIGQCPANGTCICQRTNVVDMYGSVCSAGQTCGQDCYCHCPSGYVYDWTATGFPTAGQIQTCIKREVNVPCSYLSSTVCNRTTYLSIPVNTNLSAYGDDMLWIFDMSNIGTNRYYSWRLLDSGTVVRETFSTQTGFVTQLVQDSNKIAFVATSGTNSIIDITIESAISPIYPVGYCYSDNDCYLTCGFCKSKLNTTPYCGGVVQPGYQQICKCENNYCISKYIPINNATCSDSDGGNNFTVKGTTIGFQNEYVPKIQSNLQTVQDFCINDHLVQEYSCMSEDPQSPFYGVYTATSQECISCKDGACVAIKVITSCEGSSNSSIEAYSNGAQIKVNYNDGTQQIFTDGCGISSGSGSIGIQHYFCGFTSANEPHFWSVLKPCPYGCKNGACITQPANNTTASCVNHNDCSQACDNLGINFHWMGTGSSYRSWTGTCPSGAYGCMTGQCCLGQCPSNGTCYCQRTNVVDIYGSVCSAGQTCGQDCYCHPSAIPITEEYKTVNLGEAFAVSGEAFNPYSWQLKNYDSNYLEQGPLGKGCPGSFGGVQPNQTCTYSFSFKAINSGKTTIELDKINSNDNNVAEIKYIYVTINPLETKTAYLNQPFGLKESESAEIVDYRNMMVTLNNLDPLATTAACSALNVTGGGAGCAYGGWLATVSIRMPGDLVAASMKMYEGESKDTPFGVKISFDRVDSSIATFTVYQGTNEFNFYVKTDKYSYSPGESVRIDAILSGYSSSFDFKNAAVITTVTDPNGRQYEVKMDPIGASAPACTQSVSTGTYTCAIINEYHFAGTYNIPSDASTGNYRVMSTAITSTIKKNAESSFEVENTYSNYVGVSIDPTEQHAVIGKEVTYQVTVTDKHPVPMCPTIECFNPPCQVPNCARPTYMYYLSVNGLPYNTKYQNIIGLPAGGGMTFTLSIFPSSTGTNEGVTTATTTTGTINPNSAEQRIVSTVTGEAVATTPVTTVPVKEIMFKFTVQATQQDDPRISGSDGAILYVNYVETPNPPPFPQEEVVNIELKNGWNLISAPGYGYFSLGTCSANSKPVALIYLTNQSRYASYDEALSIMGTGNLKDYLSTHSFWVYSYESCKITFNVEKYSTYSGLQLDQGWNLLGVTKDMVGETMSNIKSTCTLEKLYSWDADSQQWVAKTENDLIDKMGYGSIVRVTTGCGLNTNIIQTPVFPAG